MTKQEQNEEMVNISTKEEIEARNKRDKEKDELRQALLHYATAEASGGIKSLIDCEGCAFYLYENLGYRKVLLDTEDGKIVDCVQYAPWQLIKGYTEREVNKARKETAKEIFQDLYHDALLNTGDTVELTKLEIETLAKRYGVEVED